MTASTLPPVIGITTSGKSELGHFYLPGLYVDAVRLAGGMPILLPPGEHHQAYILELVDGLIFSGGGDLNPATYNGSLHPTIYKIEPERDAFELTLARLGLNSDVPILGICRGLEVLVVASGGSLVSHIPDEFGKVVAHRMDQSTPAEHSVQIISGSRLATMIGATEATVVSWHHQATRTVPPGWNITAHAPDGVIEALEHKHHPWAIALQWHPELSINDPLQQRILRAFVTAAQQRKAAVPQTTG